MANLNKQMKKADLIERIEPLQNKGKINSKKSITLEGRSKICNTIRSALFCMLVVNNNTFSNQA